MHNLKIKWNPISVECWLQLRQIKQRLTCSSTARDNFPSAFWCSFWISFRLWSTSEFLCGMLKTPVRSSCLSGLRAWCQHSWVYSEACAHKLAVDVSIKTARHFTQTYWHYTWLRLCVRLSNWCSVVYFPSLTWDNMSVPFVHCIPDYVTDKDSGIQPPGPWNAAQQDSHDRIPLRLLFPPPPTSNVPTDRC